MYKPTDHEGSPRCGPLGTISQRPSDREIAIEADDEKIEHRGVTGKIVEREPSVTDVRAKRPIAQYRVDGKKWHGYEANGKIGHRQTEEEVIGYGLQLFVDLEADHDHDVAEDCDDAEASRDHADGDDLPEGILMAERFLDRDVAQQQQAVVQLQQLSAQVAAAAHLF